MVARIDLFVRIRPPLVTALPRPVLVPWGLWRGVADLDYRPARIDVCSQG
jgi:hypothetical protein